MVSLFLFFPLVGCLGRVKKVRRCIEVLSSAPLKCCASRSLLSFLAAFNLVSISTLTWLYSWRLSFAKSSEALLFNLFQSALNAELKLNSRCGCGGFTVFFKNGGGWFVEIALDRIDIWWVMCPLAAVNFATGSAKDFTNLKSDSESRTWVVGVSSTKPS